MGPWSGSTASTRRPSTWTRCRRSRSDLNYTDDKSQYELMDEGEFKQAGPMSEEALPLTFYSDTYGDRFAAVAHR